MIDNNNNLNEQILQVHAMSLCGGYTHVSLNMPF